MGIILWLILGGIAGWIAGLIVRGSGLGIIGNIIVGIIGGFIVSLIGGTGVTGFNIWSLIVAIIGAVVLLLIVRLVTGGARRTV